MSSLCSGTLKYMVDRKLLEKWVKLLDHLLHKRNSSWFMIGILGSTGLPKKLMYHEAQCLVKYFFGKPHPHFGFANALTSSFEGCWLWIWRSIVWLVCSYHFIWSVSIYPVYRNREKSNLEVSRFMVWEKLEKTRENAGDAIMINYEWTISLYSCNTVFNSIHGNMTNICTIMINNVCIMCTISMYNVLFPRKFSASTMTVSYPTIMQSHDLCYSLLRCHGHSKSLQGKISWS